MRNKEIIKNEAYIHWLDVAIENRNIWEKLIINWIKAMKMYIKIADKDIPYWYDENANTGFLAAAAWKTGGVAIEQYNVDRIDKKGKISKGHCDVWMKFKGKNTFDFSAEAKKAWSPNLKKVIKEAKDKLNNAKEQLILIKNKEDQGQYQVSLCFLTPETQRKFGKKRKKEYIKSILNAFGGKNTIIASYFPEVNPKDKESGKYYPGVVLLVKIFGCTETAS